MYKKTIQIIAICLITLTTSAVSFAAIDFDNSNFSPNFSNLNISNNATIEGGLFIKTLNLITKKGGPSEIQVNGQVQFNDAIYGDDGNLKISSDVSITGNLDATSISNLNIDGDISVDNLTVEDGINPPVGSDTINISQPNYIDSTFKLQVDGHIHADALKQRNSNVPAASIPDITRVANKLRNLGLSTENSTYSVYSPYNMTIDTKVVECRENDLALNCGYLAGPRAHLLMLNIDHQRCIASFMDNGNNSGSSVNGVFTLCLCLNDECPEENYIFSR